MVASRMVQARRAIDFRGFILAMLDTIDDLCSRKQERAISGRNKLKQLERDLDRLENSGREYCKINYAFPDYLYLETFRNYLSLVKNGRYEEPRANLIILNWEL